MAKVMFEDGEETAIEDEAAEDAAPEETAAETEEVGEDEGSEDDVLFVQFGEDEQEEDEDDFLVEDGERKRAPHWLRDVRAEGRRKDARIKELERELGQREPKKDALEEALPEKPKLADFDYDEDAHEAALLDWAEQKRKADARKDEQARLQKEAEDAWAAKLSGYAEKKGALKVPDFDRAEAYVQDIFDQTQRGIVIEVADDPALLTYALGKNPKRAAELAKIKQPVQFIKAITLMEAKLNMTTRKAPPAPERVPSGRTGGGTDNTLDKLREEAARTGDMSKVLAYKRKMRA